MNRLAEHVVEQLRKNLQARKVVVWYDQRSEWESAFPDLLQDRRTLAELPKGEPVPVNFGSCAATLAIFDGSYLGLRLAVEHLVTLDTPGPLVLYLPGQKPDEEDSLLMELECAGKRWKPELRRMARDVLKSYYTDGKIDELLAMMALSYADVVQWIEQAEELAGQQGSMLKLVFPGIEQSQELLARWLSGPEHDDAIQNKNATQELQALLAHRVGMKTVSAPLNDLRERAWRYLLAGEFRADLEGDPPSALAMIPTPSKESQWKFLRQTVQVLRSDFPAAYRQRATEAENTLQLRKTSVSPSQMRRAETFPFQESSLLAWCDELMVAGDFEPCLKAYATSAASFWVATDSNMERQTQWECCRILAELGKQVRDVGAALDKFSGPPSAWVNAYAGQGGWWEMDRLHRRLETLIAQLENEPGVARSLTAVRTAYEALLHRMAVGFTSALCAAGWQIEGVVPQTGLYERECAAVAPPVALFLVDAMRYEMGQELAQQLSPTGAVQVTTAVAALPTITEVGMAALMPAAQTGFEVVEEKGKLGARVDGSFLPDLPARRKAWKARIPNLLELDLGALVEMSTKKLQNRIDAATLILVRSREIDGQGEDSEPYLARQTMNTVLGNLAKGVRKLASAGVDNFVLAADHGYQFLQEKGDEMKTPLPDGQTVDRHRRCWAGRGGSNPAGTVRLSSADLGYSGNLEFVFPKGLGIFRCGGSLAYHHGGLSLQEMVIPVVTLRAARRERKQAAHDVRVTGAPEKLATRTLGVKLELVAGLLQIGEGPVEVRPVLVAGGKEVGFAGVAVGAELDPNSHTMKLEPGKEVMVGLLLQQEAASIRVVVIDPATDTALGESPEIPVQLGM